MPQVIFVVVSALNTEQDFIAWKYNLRAISTKRRSIFAKHSMRKNTSPPPPPSLHPLPTHTSTVEWVFDLQANHFRRLRGQCGVVWWGLILTCLCEPVHIELIDSADFDEGEEGRAKKWNARNKILKKYIDVSVFSNRTCHPLFSFCPAVFPSSVQVGEDCFNRYPVSFTDDQLKVQLVASFKG